MNNASTLLNICTAALRIIDDDDRDRLRKRLHSTVDGVMGKISSLN